MVVAKRRNEDEWKDEDENDDDKTLICLAYLFLSSEHKISDDDFALFKEIGKSIEGFSDKKGEIIKNCKKFLTSCGI